MAEIERTRLLHPPELPHDGTLSLGFAWPRPDQAAFVRAADKVGRYSETHTRSNTPPSATAVLHKRHRKVGRTVEIAIKRQRV
jgi:hypothetical protein